MIKKKNEDVHFQLYFATLSKYISKIDTESDYVLWIELSKHLFKLDENVILGAVYIPPEGSNFYNEDEFSQLENEITSYCNSHKYVLLSGDQNARTSEIKDYTECDMFLADLFDFDADTISFFSTADRGTRTIRTLVNSALVNSDPILFGPSQFGP